MESILGSRTSSEYAEKTIIPKMNAASAPIHLLPKPEEAKLKVQISAPSYLFSLKENEAPPFVKPGREARPKLLIGTILDEDDVVAIISAADIDKTSGLRMFIDVQVLPTIATMKENIIISLLQSTAGHRILPLGGNLLVQKNIIANYSLPEKIFLTSLICETIEYASQRAFPASKLACLLTIYLSSHLYFKWYYWQSPTAVWLYFKELMIRHTIEDSPDGEEVFEPEECYDIVTHFHMVYLSNLPLVHILTFGAYRLKFSWPFKQKA